MTWQVVVAMLLLIVTVIAKAGEILAAWVSNDPNVLVSKCLGGH